MDPANQHHAAGPEAAAWAPAQRRGETAAAPLIARPGLLLLTTVLTELAIIGALANQRVMDRLVRSLGDESTSTRLLVASWFTYSWRLTPRDGRTAEWWGEILLIVIVVAGSALLVWCLLRGPIGFWRAFLGTWLAVVFASLIGAFVRGLCDPAGSELGNRVVRAVYGGSGPSSQVVVGSFALGLVVAVIVALMAVATRRRPVIRAEAEQGPPAFADYGPPAPAAPSAMRPWQDQHYGPPAGAAAAGASLGQHEPAAPTTQLPQLPMDERPTTQQAPAFPERPREEPPARAADQPTTQLPVPPPAGAGDQPTTQLPVPPPAGPQQGAAPPPAAPTPPPAGRHFDQPTAWYPRPPDDEELGHIGH